MDISDSCNKTQTEEGDFFRLGPSNLYILFGFTIPVLYTAILLLGILLWVYGLYFKPLTGQPYFPHILYLQLSPALHVTLTLPALFSPPTAPLVSLLQDSVSVSAMLVFTNFTIALLGGVDTIVKLSTSTSCPIGTPPLCCLLPCKKPKITTKIVKLILLPVKLLPAAIFINFLINMFLVYSGFYPSRALQDITNLHNILIVPFFISCMYTYKVFISVTSPMLLGTNHALRGILIFIMFVFGKSSLGIINILIGKK